MTLRRKLRLVFLVLLSTYFCLKNDPEIIAASFQLNSCQSYFFSLIDSWSYKKIEKIIFVNLWSHAEESCQEISQQNKELLNSYLKQSLFSTTKGEIFHLNGYFSLLDIQMQKLI